MDKQRGDHSVSAHDKRTDEVLRGIATETLTPYMSRRRESMHKTIWRGPNPNVEGDMLHVYEDEDGPGDIWIEFESMCVKVETQLPPEAVSAIASFVKERETHDA